MDELRQLSELIGRIYDAAVDPIVWTEVVERTAVWLDAPMGLLMTPFNPPSTGGYVLPFGIDQAGLELWGARYVGAPLVAARMVAMGTHKGRPYNGHCHATKIIEPATTGVVQKMI